jgi:hypothetical protein
MTHTVRATSADTDRADVTSFFMRLRYAAEIALSVPD